MRMFLSHKRIISGGAAIVFALFLVWSWVLPEGVELAYSQTVSTSSGTTTINANVPGGGGGAAPAGGAGAGAPAPAPAPAVTLEISDVVKTPISGTSYKVTWKTNKQAKSLVEWGFTLNYEIGSTSHTLFKTIHELDLENLTPNTNYFGRITSETASEKATKEFTFKTPELGFQPMKITDIVITPKQGGKALFEWKTDKPATTWVEWGLDTTYKEGLRTEQLVTSHSLEIDGLQSGKKYFARITSTTELEKIVKDGLTFTSLGGLPAISDIVATPLSATSVKISWKTSEPVKTKVSLTTEPGPPYVSGGVTINNSVTSHEVILSDLFSGKKYYFIIEADGVVGKTTSQEQSFQLTDVIGPKVLLIKKEYVNQTQAQYVYVISESAKMTVTYAKEGVAFKDGTKILFEEFNEVHIVQFNSLIPNVTYNVQLYVEDASGNGNIKEHSFKTLADSVSPPNVSNLKAQAFPLDPSGDNYQWFISLTWTNPTVSDFDRVEVRYSENTQPTYGPILGLLGFTGIEIPVQNTSQTSHIFSLPKSTNLPHTLYYTAFAVDTSGNVAPGAITQLALQEPPKDIVKDTDGDGVLDINDNCPNVPNPDQSDLNNNGIGDACEPISPIPVGPEGQPGVPGTIPFTAPVVPGDVDDLAGKDKEEVEEEKGPLGTAVDFIKDLFGVPPAEKPGYVDGKKAFVVFEDLIFSSISSTLTLKPEGKNVSVLAGFDLGVILPKDKIPEGKTVESILLTLNGSVYQFSQSDDTWFTTLIKQAGEQGAKLTVNYTDDSSDVVDFTAQGALYGLLSFIEDGTVIPLEEVRVELLDENGDIFDMSSWGQVNPTVTSKEGLYGFVVPNGRYRLRFVRKGFKSDLSIPFDVTHNVINDSYELLKTPESIADVIDPDATLVENVLNVTENVQDKVAYAGRIAGRETVKFAENPEVEEATEATVAPSVVSAVAVNTVAATGLPTLFTYLQLLLTQPLLLLQRRKRRGWGTVYDALTKNPIDLAYVRLIDAKTNRVLRTKITDKFGRFAFFTQPGNYILEASKGGYTFPSIYLKTMKDDGRYTDVYHKEPIDVKEAIQITPNIPLDPKGQDEEAGRKIFMRTIMRRVQFVISISGMVLAGVSVIIIPTTKTIILLGLHIALFFLIRRLAFPPKPKSWGIVFDALTKNTLQYAVARIFDTEYNKLLDTQMTDAKGRYAFLASQRKYYVTYEKKGYEKKKSREFDLTDKREPTVIGEKVMLEPMAAGVDQPHPQTPKSPIEPPTAAPRPTSAEMPLPTTPEQVTLTTPSAPPTKPTQESSSAEDILEHEREEGTGETPPELPKSGGYFGEGRGS